MAYQVYAGLVKFDDQTGGWVWTSKNLIFASDNPMQNTPVILEPRLSQEKNQIGSFTFTIPKALQDARGAYVYKDYPSIIAKAGLTCVKGA